MQQPLLIPFVCLVIGLVAGALAASAYMRPRLAIERQKAAGLQVDLEKSIADAQRLAEYNVQIGSLRHDLRGILSPALLVADRLSTSADPVARKAADVMIRTVERCTARLAETRIVQEPVKSVSE